jgi:hypothetical protein
MGHVSFETEFDLNNAVRTSQETHYVSATKPNRLMLFREIIAVYCENHMEHINALCGQNSEFFNVKSGGTYAYHYISNNYVAAEYNLRF